MLMRLRMATHHKVLSDMVYEDAVPNIAYVCYHDHLNTVTPRYNAVVGRHLLGPPYKRGALWDPVDLFDIIIPRQSKGQAKLPRLEVELV